MARGSQDMGCAERHLDPGTCAQRRHPGSGGDGAPESGPQENGSPWAEQDGSSHEEVHHTDHLHDLESGSLTNSQVQDAPSRAHDEICERAVSPQALESVYHEHGGHRGTEEPGRGQGPGKFPDPTVHGPGDEQDQRQWSGPPKGLGPDRPLAVAIPSLVCTGPRLEEDVAGHRKEQEGRRPQKLGKRQGQEDRNQNLLKSDCGAMWVLEHHEEEIPQVRLTGAPDGDKEAHGVGRHGDGEEPPRQGRA